MNDTLQRYTRPNFSGLIYCGTSRIMSRLIRDQHSWEDFDEQTIDSYMKEGVEMLTESLNIFAYPETEYSSLRAKELRFMLEALIEVKEVFMTE